jgi:predicted  nucleic acid-binding Zn-ribbon protein
MISSKNVQLVIIVIIACIIAPVLAAEPNEPNEPKTEIKFKIDDSRQKWRIGSQPGRGPIKPAYVAEFFIKEYGNIPSESSYGNFDRLLQTEISKSMTSDQKEFIKTSSSYSTVFENLSDMPIGYLTIRLYAVSREDAKKMALAFIELLNERAKERIKHQEDGIRKIEERIAQAKKVLPEKQKQLKEIEQSYRSIKEATHQFSSDGEASRQAKTSIVEMDKTLNALDIELAGIREKLKAIEKYRSEANLRDKLNEMYIELMIELSGLEARKKATEKIHRLEQEFLNLFNERDMLREEVNELDKTSEIKIDYNWRDNPSPEMLPPKVYQDTVTIYPVLTND